MGLNRVFIIKALIYPSKIFVLLLSSLIEESQPFRYDEGLLESKEEFFQMKEALGQLQ